MRYFWRKQIKPYLTQTQDHIFGNSLKYQVKPIVWYNFSSWIRDTIDQDQRFYLRKSRSLSFKRFQGLLHPNLKQPIFIFGSPRSGTTFLGDCLQELPEISYHYEPVLTKAAVRYIYGQQWSKKKAQIFYRAVYSWLMRIHGDGDLRFAEKTPRNSFIIPFHYETFPDAKFIHIIRDGRDVAISLAKCPWYRNDRKNSCAQEPGGYPFGPKARFWVEKERQQEFETTNDIHRCIWLWRKYLTSALEGASILPQHQYHELKYEDLVTSPSLECDKLLDFLEISDFQSRSQLHKIIAQKAKSDSVGNWQSQLSPDQLQEIYLESGDWLQKLGYLFQDVEPIL